MKQKNIFGLAIIIYLILTGIYGYKTFISNGTSDDLLLFIFSLFGVAVFLYAFSIKEKNEKSSNP
jgi:quinol-cytochrome oxidoreductase complex cytochrome b subunit